MQRHCNTVFSSLKKKFCKTFWMYDLIQVLLMHCTGSSTLYCTGIAGGYCCCCCYCCSFGGPSELHSNLKSYTPPYCMHWQKHCSTCIAGGHCQMIEVGKSRLQIDFTFFSTLFSLSHLSPTPSFVSSQNLQLTTEMLW